MSARSFWPPRWRRNAAAAPAPAASPAARKPRTVALYLPAELLPMLLVWLLPSGAVLMAALGQLALAAVMLVIAFGIGLRLWRLRARRRAAGRQKT